MVRYDMASVMLPLASNSHVKLMPTVEQDSLIFSKILLLLDAFELILRNEVNRYLFLPSAWSSAIGLKQFHEVSNLIEQSYVKDL